jgi:histidinol-phosphatase (PHP family)
MWANFHTHSKYCDGKGELMDYVQRANDLDLLSLGFSSHAPVAFTTPWTMKPELLDDYIDEIKRIKKSTATVEVYSGLEVDFIPEITSPNLFKDKVDYTIGSIHFVDEFPDGTGWEIDGTHALFLEGFSKIFNNDIRNTIHRYFELTREMMTTACPTILGHLDKIKIQNIDHKFFKETDSWYQNEIKKTIDLIQDAGAIVEVNTRGIYQKKSDTTYPSPWILEMLHQKNIPVTISSDAHHRDDIINQFPETAFLLKKIGFQTLTILHEGKWKALPFNEHGIVL